MKMEGTTFGFHVHEPDYGVMELLLPRSKQICDVNKMLEKQRYRYAFRKSEHGCGPVFHSSKGKFVVVLSNGKVIRLIVWTHLTLQTRLTCEMNAVGTNKMFKCPDYTKDEMISMNQLKKFDRVMSSSDLTYNESKELIKRCGQMVNQFGWTPCIRLRQFLHGVSQRYVFDDYYDAIMRTVLEKERTYVFLVFPGLPRELYETIFRFLDPSTYETIPRGIHQL